MRPGTVHELDKDRSGLLVIAKSDLAMADLLGEAKARTMLKGYVASVHDDPTPGRVPGRTTGGTTVWASLDAQIGRHPHHRQKMAVVERLGRYSLVRARVETDRTHQIRVHLASTEHSGAADPTYTSVSSRVDSVSSYGKQPGLASVARATAERSSSSRGCRPTCRRCRADCRLMTAKFLRKLGRAVF